jgi:hypothetical protein
MALLAQLPVDDDMSFQRSCLLKKAAADVSDWEISVGDRLQICPQHLSDAIQKITGASRA